MLLALLSRTKNIIIVVYKTGFELRSSVAENKQRDTPGAP